MSDITKCKGDNCPVKEHCYRFTAPSDEYMQSYFVDSPGEHLDNGKFECDHYWGENADKIRPTTEKFRFLTKKSII